MTHSLTWKSICVNIPQIMERKTGLGLATALVALAIVGSEQFFTKPVNAGGGNPNLTPIAYFPFMGSSANTEPVVIPTPQPVERPTFTPTGVSNCNTDQYGNTNCLEGTPVASTPVNYVETPTRTPTLDIRCPDGYQIIVLGDGTIICFTTVVNTPIINNPTGVSVISTPVMNPESIATPPSTRR